MVGGCWVEKKQEVSFPFVFSFFVLFSFYSVLFFSLITAKGKEDWDNDNKNSAQLDLWLDYDIACAGEGERRAA